MAASHTRGTLGEFGLLWSEVSEKLEGRIESSLRTAGYVFLTIDSAVPKRIDSGWDGMPNFQNLALFDSRV